jgi:Peptidase family M28
MANRLPHLGAIALGVAASGLAAAATAPTESYAKPAAQWWADITALAGDSTEGRLTGSPGYMRSAKYVISRFEAEGLEAAGVDGFMQPVAFEQQTVDQAASRAEFKTPGVEPIPAQPGEDLIIAAGGAPRPRQVAAPLVFIGYGLHLPEQGYDDIAGVELKGKIAVVLSGGPAEISGPIKSNARFARAKMLGKLGAVGMVSLTTPKQVEIPWTRQKLLSGQPGMYLTDSALRDTPDGFFLASLDPEKSETLFKGTGHTFAELCALADDSKPLPHFDLPTRLEANIAARRESVTSPNLVAKLQGRDPKLAKEYVVVSAHLDHLGIGAAISGDRIYNGAMDDASGVATVLDIAHRLKTARQRPRRSVLFLIVTAEEKGLLGSHYFASHPTVPKNSIVADLNFDMPLPLWPLKSVFVPGADESTLGADAAAVAAVRGLVLAPDPLPDRNVFIRTDQYSFVREGVPSLAFKFGFAKGTPEFKVEHDWRANRYHAPSDDLDQPGIFKEDAAKLDAYVAALAVRIANAGARPEWLPGSIFRRGAAPNSTLALPPRAGLAE